MCETIATDNNHIINHETGRILAVKNRKDILKDFQDLLNNQGFANFDEQTLSQLEDEAAEKRRNIEVDGIHLHDLSRFKELFQKVLKEQKGKNMIIMLSGGGTLQQHHDVLMEYQKASDEADTNIYFGFIDRLEQKDFLLSYAAY